MSHAEIRASVSQRAHKRRYPRASNVVHCTAWREFLCCWALYKGSCYCCSSSILSNGMLRGHKNEKQSKYSISWHLHLHQFFSLLLRFNFSCCILSFSLSHSLTHSLTLSLSLSFLLTRLLFSLFKVAWLRVESKTILTIHHHVITRNYRIGLSHSDDRHWNLHINDVQESDRGGYMCKFPSLTFSIQNNCPHNCTRTQLFCLCVCVSLSLFISLFLPQHLPLAIPKPAGQINTVPMKYQVGYLDVVGKLISLSIQWKQARTQSKANGCTSELDASFTLDA